MKLSLDGTTTWLIYRMGFVRILLFLALGFLISGAAFELAVSPTTRAIYVWARLIPARETIEGTITEQYQEGKQSYKVAYAYTIRGSDGTVQRFINEEHVDEQAFFQLKVGSPVRVEYSVSNPGLARLADNAYMPWFSFLIREILGLIVCLIGIWLIFCALGALVVNIRRRRQTPTEVVLREQEFQTLEKKGYIRIKHQALWTNLFFRMHKYTQAASYIVYRDGEMYLSLNFIQDVREREQAQSYIARLNSGGKPDPWLSIWLSQHLSVIAQTAGEIGHGRTLRDSHTR